MAFKQLTFPSLCSVLVATSFTLLSAFWSDAGSTPSEASWSGPRELQAVITEAWELELRAQPELATAYGDHRYDDQLGDASWPGLTTLAQQRGQLLARLQAIVPSRLSDAERLNRELLMARLQDNIDWYQNRLDQLPMQQLLGFHVAPLLWLKAMPFQRAKDYENYLSRLAALPRQFDQYIELARAGVRARLAPPRYLMATIASQARDLAITGEQSPFATPVAGFAATIPQDQRDRLRSAVLAAIKTQVAPAYAKLARFVAEEYSRGCPTAIGYSALPGGDAIYRFLVRHHTTTDLSPEQIHTLGQEEVARIEAQMLRLARQQGHPDLRSFQRALREDRRQFAISREQLIERYRSHLAQMEGKLPRLFGRIPRAPLIVTPLEAFQEKGMASAAYFQTDGTRPGQIIVNARDFAQQPLYTIEATAYHEGNPGHHFQYALGVELADLPAFRRHGAYSAFQEGWALYAEGLGKEVGLYQDAASEYGRLTSEMIRAVRLVLDTGLHSKHFSRRQAVDYFRQHTSMDDAYIQGEVDRYIVLPGQALSYKVGELRILALRKEAEGQLGTAFDLRAFHDQLLGRGELPLDLLERLMLAWLAAAKRGTSPHPQRP